MKKLVYGAGLLAVAVGSFAFLPKGEEPASTMLVIGRATGGLSLSDFTLSTIDPAGLLLDEVLPIKKGTVGIPEKMIALHQAETAKINGLRQQGWSTKSVHSSSIGNVYFETVYLLEKK